MLRSLTTQMRIAIYAATGVTVGNVLGEIFSHLAGLYMQKHSVGVALIDQLPAPEDGMGIMSDLASTLVSSWLSIEPFFDFIFGPFGWGFCLAGFAYTLSDWPKVKSWLTNRNEDKEARNKRANFHKDRDISADQKLAGDCIKLAKELIRVDSNNKIRSQRNHWAISAQDDTHAAWVKARDSDARSAARTNQELGADYLKILAQFHLRGIQIEMFRASLDIYNYGSIAGMLIQVSEALRSGDYYERQFEPSFHSPLGH